MKANSTRRGWTVVVLVAGLLTLSAGGLTAQRSNAVPETADAPTVLHVLNRVGFGPTPGEVERVQQLGLAAYLEQQLHPERLADKALEARLADFSTLSLSSRQLAEKYYLPVQELRRQQQAQKGAAPAKDPKKDPKMTDPAMAGAVGAAAPPPPAAAQPSPEVRMAQQAEQNVVNELMQAKVLRAVMSERQLSEVMDDFWFNHFNVFIQKGQVREYITEYEHDVIRPRVLGNFRDLLGAVAHSPAMLFYLDNFQSATPNQSAMVAMTPDLQRRLQNPRLTPAERQQMLQRMQQANNQGPRGLNENYARELMELHTLGVDGGYTQQDVQQVARALTGWTIDQPRNGGAFVFRPAMHDFGEKTILGVHFPAGHGADEGEKVLDLLAMHPQTAHHIAYQLSQRFVADEPPATLVDRAAKTFLSTKGDIREVVRTIITSPEFFSVDAYRAKVKTPLEFVVSAARASGAVIQNAQPIIGQLRQQLGMPIYGCQPPTGYSMTADAWVNTGALLSRMNFSLQLVNSALAGGPGPQGRPGGPPPPGRMIGADGPPAQGRAGGPPRPVQVNVAALAPDTSEASRQRLIDMILAGQVSDATRNTLAKAESPQQLVALMLGSPEFQKR
jgi:uncharacterized protein (DUF1800 family)